MDEIQVARFWAKVDRRSDDDCWRWTGGTNHAGYGHFGFDGRTYRSHRLSWEIAHGPISDGLQVLHRCDVPACVNPAHMFLGTPLENARDRSAKGRGNAGRKINTHPNYNRSDCLGHL